MWTLLVLLPLVACSGKAIDTSPSSETGETDTDPSGTAPTDTDWGDPCDPNPAHPSVTIGMGELEYAAIDTDDPTIELVHGPQGGFHITMALEGRYLDSDNPSIATMEGRIDGVLLADSTPYIDWRCNPAVPALQAWNLLLIYDAQPEELHLKETEVTVEVVDATGVTASATTTLTIFDPLLAD